MKLVFTLALLIIVGCTTSQDSTPQQSTTTQTNGFDTLDVNVPNHGRPYDTARGGLQITLIAYDQSKNQSIDGINNEWVELRCLNKLYTKGYRLNAGDASQNYTLPDTINKVLRIYTKPQANLKSYEISLNLNDWIWNNSAPDTAWLYDSNLKVIDSMSYQ